MSHRSSNFTSRYHWLLRKVWFHHLVEELNDFCSDSDVCVSIGGNSSHLVIHIDKV